MKALNIKVLVKLMFFSFSFAPALSHAYCMSEDSPVNNALHLAIDVSGSVDRKEMVLQMEGIEQSFQDSEVQDKLLACGCSQVSVSFWASNASLVLPPMKIKDAQDLNKIVSFFSEESRSPHLQRYAYNLSETTNVIDALDLPLDDLIQVEASNKALLISGDGMNSRIDDRSLDELKELRELAESNKIGVSAAVVNAYSDVDFLSPSLSKPIYGYAINQGGPSIFADVTDFYKKMVVTKNQTVREARTYDDYGQIFKESLKQIACKPMM